MKKITSAMIRVARMGVSLVLCLSMLCSNLLPIASLAQEETETYYSPEYSLNGIVSSDGLIEAAGITGEQDLLAWCDSATVDLYYEGTKLETGDTVPRGATVTLRINVALKNTLIKECDQGATFTYTIPSSTPVGNISTMAFYDSGTGEHLMNWSITNNVLTIQFTERFYADEGRNNVKCFVTAEGVLSTSVIINGAGTYSYPGGSSYTFNFPVGTVTAAKYNITTASTAFNATTGKLIGTYYILISAEDNLDQVVITDLPGSFLTVIPTSYDLRSGSRIGSDANSQMSVGGDGKITITNLVAKTNYYLNYQVEVSLDALGSGYLESTDTAHLADRQNSASVEWTRGSETGTVSTDLVPFNYASSNLVTVTKTVVNTNHIPDANGQVTYNITVKPTVALTQLVVQELPGLYWAGGVFKCTTAGLEQVADVSGTITIANATANTTYNFTYVVDFPYEAAAATLLNTTASEAGRTNIVSAAGYLGTTKIFDKTAQTTSPLMNLRFLTPVKSVTKSLYVSDDGKFLIDFSVRLYDVSVPSAYQAIFNNICFIEDTLGDYFTLVKSSVKKDAVVVPESSIIVDGKTFKFPIPSYNSYSSSTYIYYTVEVDRDAVLTGKLGSSQEIAPRTNTVKQTWEAPNGQKGSSPTATYTVAYNTDIAPTIAKAYTGDAIQYDSANDCFYTNFVITFTVPVGLEHLKIADVPGMMFAQSYAGSDWASQIQIMNGTNAYVGDPSDTYTYRQYDFYNIPAGTYTITYPAKIDFATNGYTYAQIVASSTYRRNTVTLTYPKDGVDTSLTAVYTTVPAYAITITKAGAVQKNEDGTNKLVVIDGVTYAMIDWTITLTSTGTNMTGGTLTDSLFGRQFFAENSASNLGSFLNVYESTTRKGYGTPSSTQSNTVGSQQFLQEFTYNIGSGGEAVTATIKRYIFTSYVREPNVPTTITSSNQAVFEHPLWGRYVATAEVDTIWTTVGTIAPATISKSLVSVDTTTNAPNATATWKSTIQVPSGTTVTSGLFTDYMNFTKPASYFDVTELNLSVAYADGSLPAPAYEQTIAADSDGIDRLYIKFTESLTKSVVITYTTSYNDIDSTATAKKFINFSDFEYAVSELGEARFYVSDQDYWSIGRVEFTKTSGEPRYDETLNQFVIDWEIVVDDALRIGMLTKVTDTLPAGLTLVEGSVQATPISDTVLVTTSGTYGRIFTFTPTERVTTIKLTTAIDAAYLHGSQTFTNNAALWTRNNATANFASASDDATFENLRTLSKTASEPVYNSLTDQYEITWTIALNDKTSKTTDVYLNERLPDGVTYVEGSIAVTPNRLNQIEVAADGKSFMISLNPGDSDDVVITFKTTINDDKLYQDAGIVDFRNYVDLLAANKITVLQTADAMTHIATNVRELTKSGYAHYDQAEQKFVVDWVISVIDQTRAGRQVILAETLPDGLTLGSVVVRADDGGAILSHQIQNVSGDGRTFEILYTSPIAQSTVYIRTYVDDGQLDGTVATRTYLNTVDLMTADGRKIDTTNATVSISTAKSFQKSFDKVVYDEVLGKYVIHWNLDVSADLFTNVPLIIEDTLPAGLSLIPTNAVTCTDTDQPTALTYSQAGQVVQINLIPLQGVTHLVLRTTISNESLIYEDGTAIPKYVNTANVVIAANPGESLGLSSSAECDFGLKRSDMLNKTGQQLTGSNRIVYTVEVNKPGIDLANGAAEIILRDTLNVSVTMLMDQVRVYNGTTGLRIPAQDYQVQYETSTRMLTFRLPNRLYLKVEFEVLLNGNPNDNVSLDNTIALMGDFPLESSTGPLEFHVQEPTAGMSYDSDHVKIHKFDRSDTSKNLAGASFILYRVTDLATGAAELVPIPDGAPTQTNSIGILHLPSADSSLVVNALYYVVETGAPDGYLLDTTRYYFFIPGSNGAEAQAALGEVTNAGYNSVTVSTAPQLEISNVIDLKTRVAVSKVFTNGSGQTELLSGAKLEIWDENRANKIYSFTSGSVQTVLDNLKESGADLQIGKTYWLVETEAPAGFKLAEPVSFKLTSQVVEHAGESITIGYAEVTMRDDPTQITFRKEDHKGQLIAGASLQIIDESGSVVTSFTSTEAVHTVNSLSYGTIYGLRETAAPVGYLKTDAVIWFMLLADGTVASVAGTDVAPVGYNWPTSGADVAVTLKNDPRLLITKLDDTTETEPVIGAELELYAGTAATGQPILTWITDGTPYAVAENLPAGSYTLHEKTAPGGYELAADKTFNVTGTETSTIHITMTDPKITTTSLSGTKQWFDYDGVTAIDPAQDVTIQLYRSDDPTTTIAEQVLSAATKDKDYSFTGLEIVLDNNGDPYTYHVREVPVPGYFSEVVTDGIVNYKTRVTIQKQNASGEQLSGARLQLRNQSGDIVKNWETGTTPTVFTDVIGGTYTLHEVTPPIGYASMSPNPLTIVIKGDTVVTVQEPSLNVTIEKVDQSGNKLAGAWLQLFEGATATGTPYLSWTSTTDAYIPTKPLTAGATYTLHEASAPLGYLVAADITFVVRDEATAQVITMEDAPIVKTSLTVTKAWDDDNNRDQKRPTEVYVILCANGDAIETVKLDADNNWTHTFENLFSTNDYNQPTIYTVDETEVPTGYSKSIEVDPQDSTKVTITNSYTPAKRDVTVQKVWNDNNNVKSARPISITVELLEGATATGETATLNVGNNWTYTWQNLPENSAGVAINYTVREVTVPAGYVSQIAEDDVTKTIIVTNTYANVVINKYRAAIDGTPSQVALGGAQFEVLSQDKSSVVVPAFTMGADGTYTLSGNLAPGSYWLRETFTPAGHYKADDLAFTVSGNDQPVNIYDKSTVVAIRKLGEGANLEGAKLGVYNAAGAELFTFTTTAATQVFAKDGVQVGNYTGLPAGTVVFEGILEAGQQYTLKELTVPGTYLKAADVTFTVNSDSTITNVSMVDSKIELISVQVTKTWDDLGVTGITHPTVTIDLFRSDDLVNPHRTDTLANGVTTLTFSGLDKTDELGVLYSYTVKERPVAGYISNVNGFTIANTRTTVSIQKLAGNTQALVPGAQLQIMSADGTQPVYGPFTSASTAVVLTGILTGGTTYQLKEVGLPAGFVQADPVIFTVDQAAIEVKMIDEPTVVLIQKQNANSDLLPGATLEIRDGGIVVKTLVTDNTVQVISWNNQPIGDYSSLNLAPGSILLEGILESGKTYQLVETQIPSGYKKAVDMEFTVDATGNVTYVSMTDPTDDGSYEVVIKKLDQYGDPVVGAQLQLKNTQTGSVIAAWTTTDEPYRISLPASLAEIYELSELNAPEGYIAAASMTFAVHRDAPSVEVGITMIDELVDRNVHGTKTWVDRGLTGAHPDIYIDLYQDGSLYLTKTLTNGTTTYDFLNLPAVDVNNKKYVYTVKERAVDGYATVQTGNDFTNTATQVTIRKVDEQDVLVSGVVLAIYDLNNDEIIRWNTADQNGNPKVLVGVLNANTNYTLVEVTEPMGYLKAANIPFLVNADGSVQTVTMTNVRITWEVTIRKVAILAGAETFLPNAVLSVFDTTNPVTPVKSWNTSDTNPMVITDLDPTKSYVLKETTTPAGFVTAADVPFDVTMISNGEYTITMTNLQTAVNVEKRLGAAPLVGAWMEIRNTNGTPVRRWLSDGSVKEILGLEAGNIYTLHEILPPAGYATNPLAIQFQVSADGIFEILGTVANTRTTAPRESLTEIGNPSAYQSFHNSASDDLIITDEPLNIKIEKVDEDGNRIAGASLQLFEGATATGTPYLSWTSTLDLYVPTKPLEAGATYTLHEVTAPEGYLLAGDITFVVKDQATEQVITMEDSLIVKTSLTVTKAWDDDNNRDQKRPAEVYVELRADGALQGTAVKLDASNSWTHTFSNLLSTTPDNQAIAYTVDETAVPLGYSKSIVVNPQDATKVTITNSYMPAKRDVTVQKIWNDNGNINNARPASITVALLADSVDTGSTATLNTANSWRHTWPDLPTNNAGVEIQYTVKEVTVPAGYVSEIAVNGATKLITVTNTYANVVINKYRAAIDGTASTTPLGGAQFEVLNQDKSVVVVPAFTMGAAGTYTLSGNLAPGSYWLRETFTPAGHYKADDVAFTVSGNDQPVNIYDRSTVVAIRKLGEGNANLEGAKLGVYNAAGAELFTFTTTAATQVFAKDGVQVGNYTGLPAGTVVFEGILEAGQQYTLKELTVPGTYLKAADVIFTVNSDSTITNVSMVDSKIELISVQVTKIWHDLGVTGITHPTVTIDLFRSDDLVTPHRTSTLANGATTLTFSGLDKTDELGALYTYSVKERPVAGYISTVNGFTITNTRISVSIKKLAGNTQALIPGAQLQIMSADGMQSVYGPFTTTAAGPILTGILSDGETYQLKEVGLPVGFVQANPVTFTVDQAAIEVKMVDRPTVVVIQKMNTSGDLLPGATLAIRDGGTTVKTVITDNTAQVISWNNQPIGDYASLGLAPGSILLEGILESGKQYQLVETNPPTGYKEASPVSFTVGTTGAVEYVSMTDPTDDGHYEVKINKLDQLGDPVVGAQLQLKNTQTSVVIETWTTTGQPKVFSLPASLAEIYELSELSAPEGYTAAASMTFAVHRDAPSVTVGITMVDVLVERNIRGTKTWVDRSLTGAHPDIYIDLYQDGSLYLTKTLTNGTTTYDFLNLPAVNAMNKKYVYTVKERAVNGYGTVQTGNDFTNTATQVTIRKVDENGNFLPDVVLAINDRNNNEILRWNTSDADGNPKVLVGVLNANTNYTLVEVTAPMGYAKAANIPFLVNANGSTQTLTMTNKKTPWAVTIRKVAKLNGTDALLPNVVLSVFDTDDLSTPVKSWNTQATNPMVITNLDPTKHYVLKETTTPAGFIPAADIFFDVTQSTNNQQTITMTNLQTAVNVRKMLGSTQLAGAWMEIRNASGTPVRRWLSNGSVKEILGLEIGQQYTLHEILPPPGYVTNPLGIQFEVFAEGKFVYIGTVSNVRTTVSRENLTAIDNPLAYQGSHNSESIGLTIIDDPLDIKISKVGLDGARGLPGATLELYKGTPLTAANLLERWVSTDSPHTPNVKLEVGKTYILHEAEAPVGYQCAADMQILIQDITTTQLFTMTDNMNKVTIEKRDAQNGNFVSGARLTLVDNVTNSTVATWITDGNPKVFEGVLVTGRSYTLSETAVPINHYKADPITFSVQAKGTNQTIVMVDSPIVVKISKQNEEGTLLGGARLALYGGSQGTGTQLEAWDTTTDNPHTLTTPLEEGQTYSVREVLAPNGYYTSPNLVFTVQVQRNPDGSAKDIVLVMTNYETRVAILKYDQQTNLPLSGARLVLKDASGNVIDSWISGSTPRIVRKVVEGQTLTLTETAAPEGYAIASPVTFTVPVKPTSGTPNVTFEGNKPMYNVKMYDPHIYKFLKVDNETREPLAGASLSIRDSHNTVIDTWISTTEPHEVIGRLEPGVTYTVVEKTPPAGYNLTKSVIFTVRENGSLDLIKINNKRIVTPTSAPDNQPISIPVTKIWQDDNDQAGKRPSSITINLYQKARTEASYPSTPFMTATMNGTGNTWTYTFTDLPRNFDYLVQESAVSGYNVSYANNGHTITNWLAGMQPTPTPFATPTAPLDDGGLTDRPPVGLRFVDGEWVYIDEYDTPLGVVPFTGDDSNWPLWIAATLIPMLGILIAVLGTRRRSKRRKAEKVSSAS